MRLHLFLPAIFLIVTAQAQQPPRSTVQATGTASVSVTPDQATINVSAVTQAATAQDAANQNATLATNIQSALTAVIGSSGTLKTISYSVSPNYNNPQNSAPVLIGYTVTNTIQVTLSDLSIVGKVIDTATQAGASRIDGLSFGLKDDTSARTQALKAATVQAKAKADAMASSVGLHTGSFLVIQEAGAVVQTLTPSPIATATPIQVGNLSVTGNVTISVELTQ